jgi:hypothetical protein
LQNKSLGTSRETYLFSIYTKNIKTSLSNCIPRYLKPLIIHNRMISCLTPDIQSPISSVSEPFVSKSTWIARAAGRSWASIAYYIVSKPIIERCIQKQRNPPLERTSSWSTTGLDNVSQFNASKRGLIRRSKSSTRRFCCGWRLYVRTSFQWDYEGETFTGVVCFIRFNCSEITL